MINKTLASTSELPKLTGEIMLEVYTHKSVKTASSSVREYDSERLALLGKSILDMAVTHVLFAQRPFQSAEDIAVRTTYCPLTQLSLREMPGIQRVHSR